MTLSYPRVEYVQPPLRESEVDPDPIQQFRRWLEEAIAAKLKEPSAMTLATATRDGVPSARMVLLRGLDERGFVFFTNYDSRKGDELEANPRAALVFYWTEFDRQVRVEGTVSHTSPEESDVYFAGRPEGSRLGAWASPQSKLIPSRDWLEARVREFQERYGTGTIPRPEIWGGYRVTPHTIEFWQGQPSRLHDRLRYRKSPEGGWVLERLAP